MRFARVTSSAAVSSLWRPTSARNSCRESAAPDSDSAAQTAASALPSCAPHPRAASSPRRRPGVAYLETDGLELTRDLLGFLVVQLVLENECLELRRFHPAALLGALDQSLDLIGFEQFGQLVLRQERFSVLSRTPCAQSPLTLCSFARFFQAGTPMQLSQADNAASATVIPPAERNGPPLRDGTSPAWQSLRRR